MTTIMPTSILFPLTGKAKTKMVLEYIDASVLTFTYSEHKGARFTVKDKKTLALP